MSKIKFIYLFIFLFLITQSVFSTVYDEKVVFDFDGRNWVADYAKADKNSQTIEYILEGEAVENWTELVTTMTFPLEANDKSFELLLEYYEENARKSNPGFTWTEVERTSSLIIKEFVIEPQDITFQNEYTIAAFIKGDLGMHLVLYASHDKDIFEKYKTQWIHSFSNFSIQYYDETTQNFNAPLLDDTTKMIHVVYRMYTEEKPDTSFFLKPKKLWRSGTEYFRMEEEYDKASDMQLHLIVDEPDVWMVNNAIKKGQHIVDPGPTYNTRVPVFGENKENGLMNFEIGKESAYFDYHNARNIGDTTINDISCSVHEMTKLYWVLRLYVRSDTNLPYMVSRKGPDMSTLYVYYDTFTKDLPLDKTFFEKPTDVTFVEE